MKCPKYYPDCKRGAVQEFRFKDMSFILMCQSCKQHRLEEYPELRLHQKGGRFEDAPLKPQNEFRDHKTLETKQW